MLGSAGTLLANGQEDFLGSLARAHRQDQLEERRDKKIPADVEFVCLVGQMVLGFEVEGSWELGRSQVKLAAATDARGDGVVGCDGQWTEDLQAQGIPAVPLEIDHVLVLRRRVGVEKIADLVRTQQARLTAADVAEIRGKLTGKGSKLSLQLIWN